MKKQTHYYLIIALFISTLFPNNEKLFFGSCDPFSRSMKFDCYHDYKEMVKFLKDVNQKYPDYTDLVSIGKSFQGRDLWLLTVTDFKTGKPEDKPAIWVDGGVDSDEVIATEAALGLIHRLVTANDKATKTLMKTRVFYIIPNMIPDGS